MKTVGRIIAMNNILSALKTGDQFFVSDVTCLTRSGIDADQQPFVVDNVNSPIKEYVYVKDRHGIKYLLGPGYMSVEKIQLEK